jgi:hypothetical protein
MVRDGICESPEQQWLLNFCIWRVSEIREVWQHERSRTIILWSRTNASLRPHMDMFMRSRRLLPPILLV